MNERQVRDAFQLPSLERRGTLNHGQLKFKSPHPLKARLEQEHIEDIALALKLLETFRCILINRDADRVPR